MYAVDDNGLYKIDQQGGVEDFSDAVATLFRESTDPLVQTLDFSKKEFWFVRVDKNIGVVRFHVSFTGDTGKYPSRMLVYDPDSKAFWLESYPHVFSASAQARDSHGSLRPYLASESGLHVVAEGLTDDGTPVDYAFRSGNFTFETDATVKNGGQQNSRNVSVVYRPTDSECLLKLGSYYNGSEAPRGHVAVRDRGVGFINQIDEPAATVNMAKLPHQEAESHGIARALFAGKTIEAVYGGDTHVSVRLYGQQNDSGPVVIHSVNLEGVSNSGSD
jgi:hypothetical protein